ncbi:MAG: anti-sigma factor, partial [Mesorhizobium sp.]
LAAAYPEIEPPASVKTAVDRRLFASAASVTAPTQPRGLWSSLAFWRGLAAAAVAALAIYIAVPILNPPVEP